MEAKLVKNPVREKSHGKTKKQIFLRKVDKLNEEEFESLERIENLGEELIGDNARGETVNVLVELLSCKGKILFELYNNDPPECTVQDVVDRIIDFLEMQVIIFVVFLLSFFKQVY